MNLVWLRFDIYHHIHIISVKTAFFYDFNDILWIAKWTCKKKCECWCLFVVGSVVWLCWTPFSASFIPLASHRRSVQVFCCALVLLGIWITASALVVIAVCPKLNDLSVNKHSNQVWTQSGYRVNESVLHKDKNWLSVDQKIKLTIFGNTLFYSTLCLPH